MISSDIPDNCPFWYATALFKPVKSTTSGAKKTNCRFCSNRIRDYFSLSVSVSVYRRDISTFLNYLMI